MLLEHLQRRRGEYTGPWRHEKETVRRRPPFQPRGPCLGYGIRGNPNRRTPSFAP